MRSKHTVQLGKRAVGSLRWGHQRVRDHSNPLAAKMDLVYGLDIISALGHFVRARYVWLRPQTVQPGCGTIPAIGETIGRPDISSSGQEPSDVSRDCL